MTELSKAMMSAAAASLVVAHAAAAEDMIIDDELFLAEAPMNATELREARGGFRVGELEFDITVNIAPVTATPIPEGGLFGQDGLFGDGGVFNDNPPIPEDGLFGEHGVFGEGGVFGDANGGPDIGAGTVAAPPALSPVDPSLNNQPLNSDPVPVAAPPAQNVPNPAGPAPVTQTASAPAGSTGAAASAASTASGAPAVQTAGSVPVAAAPADPNPAGGTAPSRPAGAPIQTQVAQTEAAPTQPGQAAAAPATGTQPPSAPAPAAGPLQLSSGLSLSGGADQTRVVINNSLNDVIVRYSVDLDIAVSNFSAQAGFANIGGVATQGLVTQSLLGSLR